MRLLLLALLLLLAGQRASAQRAPLPAGPVGASPAAAPDTAAALHHLFARYRARRLRVAAGTLLIGSGLAIASAASIKHANDPLEAGFDGFGAILAGTVTAVLVPVELVAFGRVSRRHERHAIAQWQARQLPANIRRALSPRDFR